METMTLYVDLSRTTLQEAEAFTARELDGGCVIPGSLRIVSTPESRARDEFWRAVEQRQKDRRPVLRRVV